MNNYDVAIIGAGPYGLSAAAHLKALSLDVAVFGRPMHFWERHMPVGMLLRSPCGASDLSDTDGKLTLAKYLNGSCADSALPIPLSRFVDYGRWFQQKTFPNVDLRNVVSVTKESKFRLRLEDGEEIATSRVIIAAGLGSFAYRPPQFAGFPGAMVSHASEHSNFVKFKSRKVAVLGAGQSAIESAALLRETGADVELLIRGKEIKWLKGNAGLAAIGPLAKVLWAWPHVGPAGISHLIARPNCFKTLPRFVQTAFGRLPAAGAAWLRPRVEHKIPIINSFAVEFATRHGDKMAVTAKGGLTRQVDHVLLATGYRVEISQYTFIMPQLLAAISTVNGYPWLNSCFESSVPGLHFIGATAAWSFGPLFKFVAGASFAAKAVAGGIGASHRYSKTDQCTTTIDTGSREYQGEEARLQ